MRRASLWFPLLVALVALAALGRSLARTTAPTSGSMPLDRIGLLPVSAGGRTKPLDTFARNTLLRLSGRQTYEADSGQGPAIEWLLELWTNPERSAGRRVFRIDHPDVRSLVGATDEKRTRFSWSELSPQFTEIVRQAELASAVERKRQDPFQRQITDLYGKLAEYAEVRALRTPYAIAPLAPGEQWAPLVAADPRGMDGPRVADTESARALQSILVSYARGDAESCRAQVDAYLSAIDTRIVASDAAARPRGLGFEVAMSRFEPFYQSAALYLGAFLLACFGLLAGPISPDRWKPAFLRSALGLIAIAFVVHTVGLAGRIYLQGRPPVTNLYSSAVFIGWACVPVALLGEWFSRIGVLTIATSLIGFATLVVAHNLSASGDTMEMMQAVLDSNFWLATHVVVVTIGYSATFLAGFIAVIYALGGVTTRLLSGEPMKALPKMIYGVICFATVASFVGTVLGGIWADQSWGRFWGWDPKENGAALIVLWNLMILHARWGGMIRERGTAALAIAGNIVTAWSWFGTNMLGVGLHSYGFMDSAVFALAAFCVAQLVLVAVALVPAARWRSAA